jgi:hypothetical protein
MTGSVVGIRYAYFGFRSRPSNACGFELVLGLRMHSISYFRQEMQDIRDVQASLYSYAVPYG